jgi:hypothetical protein
MSHDAARAEGLNWDWGPNSTTRRLYLFGHHQSDYQIPVQGLALIIFA